MQSGPRRRKQSVPTDQRNEKQPKRWKMSTREQRQPRNTEQPKETQNETAEKKIMQTNKKKLPRNYKMSSENYQNTKTRKGIKNQWSGRENSHEGTKHDEGKMSTKRNDAGGKQSEHREEGAQTRDELASSRISLAFFPFKQVFGLSSTGSVRLSGSHRTPGLSVCPSCLRRDRS